MKKEKIEELYVRWIDNDLSSEEQAELAAYLETDDSLTDTPDDLRALMGDVGRHVPDSIEPPHGDFFNSQLMRKVDLEILSKTPAKKAERWWQSLQWAWAPAGALALVLSFFAGHRLARPSDAEGVAGLAPQKLEAAALPSVYFTNSALEAELIADDSGGVSGIVVSGLSALNDDLDLATAMNDSGISMPIAYVPSRNQPIH